VKASYVFEMNKCENCYANGLFHSPLDSQGHYVVITNYSDRWTQGPLIQLCAEQEVSS